MPAGRPKKYTKKRLKEDVLAYFASISRTKELYEMVSTDERDDKGKPIFQRKVILNDAGEPIVVKEYVTPPSILRLCLFLDIDRSTWQNYADEWPEIAEYVRSEIESYLEEQLVTREKGVQGIIFNLQNNYGWKQKQEVELGAETRRAMEAPLKAEDKLKLIMAAKAAQAQDLPEGVDDYDEGAD